MVILEWIDKDGFFEEDGINEYDVVMLVIESVYINELVLGYDLLVENGFNEEVMIMVVFFYVKMVWEGVVCFGQLIVEYGIGEINGVFFVDNDEVWYFEMGGGYYWVV